MIDYHTFCQIQEGRQNLGLTVRQIAAKLGLHRHTVRKYLHQERYARAQRSHRTSKLDPYKPMIRLALQDHDLSITQILQRLQAQGYPGKRSILSDYLRTIRPPKHPAFLTLSFAPGEAAQIDFTACGAIPLGNLQRRLYAFVMVLCYSRMLYVEFTLKQSLEHFLTAQKNAFEYFGAIPRSIIVDNCKTAILDHPRYSAAVPHPQYADFAAHYGFAIKACNVRAPNEKGRVENGGGYVKSNFLNGLDFNGLIDLNGQARIWMEAIANVRIHAQTREQPITLFAADKAHCLPLPLHPYDCARIQPARANSQFRVAFESNRYSVPAEYASRSDLSLHLTPDHLRLFCQGQLIAQHPRSYQRHQEILNPDHERALLQQRRRAREQKILQLFLTLSPQAETFYRGLEEHHLQPRHHLKKILALVELHGHQTIAKAIDTACCFHAFSSDYIANLVEQYQRLLPPASPLQLIHKTDLLDLDLPPPNLSLYDHYS